MGNLRRWWLRSAGLVIALILPFYFLQFGYQPYTDENGNRLRVPPSSIFVFSDSHDDPLPASTIAAERKDDPFKPVSIETPAQGIWGRPGYSRGFAAIGGMLVPFLILVGIGYSFLPRNSN
jgi:hypothetical protein